MSFAFIPRAVKKKNHPPVLVSSRASSANIYVGAQVTSESVDHSRDTKVLVPDTKDDDTSTSVINPAIATAIAPQKGLFDLEDLAQLVCLALSEYAVWADVDLRRKIHWANNQDYHDDDTENMFIDDKNGYIALAYILQHSEVFRLSSSIINQPQTTFVKSIRTHASHVIDVRLIIPSSSSCTFPRNDHDSAQWAIPHIQTGYELRRKEISSALSKHGKKEWDALTIYAENIPIQFRSVPGIARFFTGLLSLSSSSSFSHPSVPRIQNISLPVHHQDQPNSIPICKGFALVTLSHDEDVDTLLKTWSWDHPTDVMNSDGPMETGIKSAVVNTKGGEDENLPDEEISPLHLEATKFGLRILTKAKWEELKAEYLLYRQELIDEINKFQDQDEIRIYGGRKRDYVDDMHDPEEQITEEDSQRTNQIQVQQSVSTKNTAIATNDLIGTASSPTYPPGCLVFVRNVHPQTNKTSLRNLFLHAREVAGFEDGKKDDDGLDYLDYTKGMDCCYIRLRTPRHAQHLVHCLSFTPIVQTSGLDASGVSLASLKKGDSPSNPITAEQVLGKREEVYWQKVPEKIRKQAVDKARSRT